MTSESVMLGSSVRCFENRRMYSRRDSPGYWRQLRRSYDFLGRTYVPWKFPAKALTRSSYSEICARGRCSSHARVASERKVADDEVAVVRPSQLACQPVVRKPQLRPCFLEYLVMVVGARNRAGNDARRMAQLKARGPGGLGDGLGSSSLS
jgi:hypothetical protein